MKIGIIAAMSSERKQLTGLLSDVRTEHHGRYDYCTGHLNGNTLYIMECGIGKVNAAVGTTELTIHCESNIHGGLICSGDKFITNRAEMETIKTQFPKGLAVDMESGAIAQVCYLYGIPFISFRIISDTPFADGHWAQYKGFWDTLADRSFGVIRTFLNSLPQTL